MCISLPIASVCVAVGLCVRVRPGVPSANTATRYSIHDLRVWCDVRNTAGLGGEEAKQKLCEFEFVMV
eukprot:7389456-Prymnesium_polylepis.1